jgi:two-component system phosphate regulon response regulator PhoB
MPAKILVIDDEEDLLEIISMALKREGYEVITSQSAEQSLDIVRVQMPSLIILDNMLPGMSGFDFCRQVRASKIAKHIPIIMLSAKAQEGDRLNGLELGADDYITKPFSTKEVILRIRAVLRRSQTQDSLKDQIIVIDRLVVDMNRHICTLEDKPVELTPTEFKLLSLLMARRGRVQSRERLLNDVWDYESSIETRTVDTHIRRLREKLGKHSHIIETVRGIGYRIRD